MARTQGVHRPARPWWPVGITPSALPTDEKELSMKLIKPVTTPQVTPLTTTQLKQVVGGLRGATGGGSGGGDLGSNAGNSGLGG